MAVAAEVAIHARRECRVTISNQLGNIETEAYSSVGVHRRGLEHAHLAVVFQNRPSVVPQPTGKETASFNCSLVPRDI